MVDKMQGKIIVLAYLKNNSDERMYENKINEKFSQIITNEYNLYYLKSRFVTSKVSFQQVIEFIESQKEYFDNLIKENSDLSEIELVNLIATIITNWNKDIKFAGAYAIINKKDKGLYIGESTNVFSRFINHVDMLYSGTHHCEQLQKVFHSSYGIGDFNFKPLYVLETTNGTLRKTKIETLYLEAAFYFLYKEKGYKLYNTLDPLYELLNKKEVTVINDLFTIQCGEVLELLYKDYYNVFVFDKEIKKKLKDIIKNHEKHIYDNYKEEKRKNKKKEKLINDIKIEENQKNNNTKENLKNKKKERVYLPTTIDDALKSELIPDNFKENMLHTIEIKDSLITYTNMYKSLVEEKVTQNDQKWFRQFLFDINILGFVNNPTYHNKQFITKFAFDNNYVRFDVPYLTSGNQVHYLFLYTNKGYEYIKNKLLERQ